MKNADYLWYIIPGTLCLFPLLIWQNSFLKNLGFYFIPFLILSFTIGYILHQIYRLWYRRFKFENRPLIEFLRKKLEHIVGDKINGGKKIKGRKIDALYNYFIYSNKQYKSQVSTIKTRSYNLSSICTSIIGSIIGSIITLILLFRSINFIYQCVYFLVFLFYAFIFTILLKNYFLYEPILNDNEVALVSSNLHKFGKEKVEKILKDLKFQK